MKAFIILFLLSFSNSIIPEEYRELANQAIKNSKRKIPKEMREETKYPGEYDGTNYHFTLLKTFTNAETNDIKGFATNESKFAIVKRKKFNLKDGFVFIDPETQTLYNMKRTIASDENVNIYECSKTDIFSLMTNFYLYGSSEENIPVNYTYLGTKLPQATFTKSYNWDTSRNKPELKTVPNTPFQYGFGAYASVGVNAVFSFKSLKDVKCTVSIQLVGDIGAEIVVPDNSKITIPDRLLVTLQHPIPGLGLSGKFLGMKLSLGSIFDFTLNLTDMAINIPNGFDYYKGYQLTASKYYQITPFSVSDSKWTVKLVLTPEQSLVKSFIKTVSTASFTGTINVVFTAKFQIKVGSIDIFFDIGLLIPFAYKIAFDSKKCMLPYLNGKINIPFYMFYSFSGLKVWKVQVIKAKADKKKIYSFAIGPFCINSKKFYEGNKKFIQGRANGVNPFYIDTTDIKEKRTSGAVQVYKQFCLSVLDTNKYLIGQRFYPRSKYSDVIGSSFSFVVPNIPTDGSLKWNLYYGVSKNQETIGHYENNLEASDIVAQKTYNLQIDEGRTDITSYTNNFYQCQVIEAGRMFTRTKDYIAFTPRNQYSGYYTMVCFDSEGELHQNNCDYTSSFWANYDFRKDSIYYQTAENFILKLESLNSTKDDFYVQIFFSLNYYKNSQYKNVRIGMIDTRNYISKGSHTASELHLDGFSIPFYAPLQYLSNISCGGRVIFKSTKKTITIPEMVIYYNKILWPQTKIAEDTFLNIKVYYGSPTVAADFNAAYVIPEQELLAETIMLEPKESEKITVQFRENEMYKIIDLTLKGDLNSGNNHYMLVYTESGSNFRFLYETDRKTLNENCFYCLVSQRTYLSIVIRRDEFEAKSYNIRFEFFRSDTFELEILNQDKHSTIKFDNTIQSGFIIPLIDKHGWYYSIGLENYKYSEKFILLGENTALFLRKYSGLPTSLLITNSVDFYLTYSALSDMQPMITVNLSFIAPALEKSLSYSYTIYCPTGYKIMAKKNETVLGTADVIDGTATFQFNDVGDYTFIPICRDNKGQLCQITYETPKSTGYHLIRYPNLDGISVTGSGFYVELIPVVAGKSFTYYKTYEEDIQKIREYSNDQLNLKIKIDTIENENSENNRVCIYDENKPDEIIPFSRKYFSNNIDDLLQSFGITPDPEVFDYSQIDTDENGCLVFGPNLISKTKIKTLPSKVCDIPSSSIVNPDYDPHTSQPTQSMKPKPTPSSSIITSPITSSPITSSPITSSPITSSPITSSPITSSPITSSPITPSPITSSPITSSPITSSPITPSPITSSTPDSSSSDKDNSKSKQKTIIIVSVICILLVIAIGIGVFIYIKKKQVYVIDIKNKDASQNSLLDSQLLD